MEVPHPIGRELPIGGDPPMPRLGLGTWQLRGAACREAVDDALALGFRHIDTAQGYENEAEVGAALEASRVPREQLWVTTKLRVDDRSRDEIRRAVGRSLERLRTVYVDAVLVHWPPQETPLEPALEALRDVCEHGWARHVGVSNFSRTLLDRALRVTPVVCNQIELHPFLGQKPMRAYARERGVGIVAYSPLAQGRVAREPRLRTIGERHGKSPAQVSLRWLLQLDGVAAIPKAASPEHRRADLDVFDFGLSAEEMAEIEGLERDLRLVDPEHAPDWDA